MEAVIKALDTVVGANLIRQDLAPVVLIQDGRPRPVLTNAPQVPATAIVHTWDEQGLIGVGTGAASYQDGTTPPADALASVQFSNKCCRVGKTASVTDDMTAAFRGGGRNWILADGQMEQLMQEAIDFQTELKSREVADEMEWMHVSGDQTVVSGFPGGQCDGLSKWILANGQVYTPATATNVAPVALTEVFIRDLMRLIAESFPTARPNVVLVPPELKADFNTFVGSGAGNPIVRVINPTSPTTGLVAGTPEVTMYDSGYGVLQVREEPNLSPLYNPLLTGQVYQNLLFYNDKLVKNASLRPLGAETLARIATSLQRMVTTTFTQEHMLGKHAGAIRFLKSSVT